LLLGEREEDEIESEEGREGGQGERLLTREGVRKGGR
jgi:hypothetical protein